MRCSYGKSSDGEIGRRVTFHSDAEETLGIIGISRVAKGERRSCGGFIWRFTD